MNQTQADVPIALTNCFLIIFHPQPQILMEWLVGCAGGVDGGGGGGRERERERGGG